MMQKKLGIVGGGQLGRMLAQAAKKLGVETIVLDPTPQSPAGQVASKQIIGDFKDPKKILELAEKVDYLTFEIESAEAKILKALEKAGKKVNPSPQTLETIQDKFKQKVFLQKNKIPVPKIIAIKSETDFQEKINSFGFPVFLKAKFHAYDGHGNALIENQSRQKKAFQKLEGKDLYMEDYVPFKKELAIQIVRDIKGNIKVYPLVETIQKNNICHMVIAPAEVSEKIYKEAEKLAFSVGRLLKGAGIFGIEMFLTKEGKVLLNEIAPRVHNSGHYTIEACSTSQFEQHVRAVCGMKLGKTDMKVKHAVMINILGERIGKATVKGLEKVKKLPGVYVHIYGKFETRKERKMGHVTAIGNVLPDVLSKAKKVRSLITI